MALKHDGDRDGGGEGGGGRATGDIYGRRFRWFAVLGFGCRDARGDGWCWCARTYVSTAMALLEETEKAELRSADVSKNVAVWPTYQVVLAETASPVRILMADKSVYPICNC